MREPLPFGRLLLPALILTLLPLILGLAGCGGDKKTTDPVVTTLGDLELTLEVSAATVALSDTVSAQVLVTGAPADVLDDFAFAWGWGSEYEYWDEEDGLTRITAQFFSPGEQELRVRVSDGESSVVLTAAVTVTLGGTDGSLDMIRMASGPVLRGDRPSQTSFSFNTPQKTITISQFSLARTEMTNATCAEALNWAAERDLVGLPPNPQFLVWVPDSTYGQWQTILDFEKCDLVWSGHGVSVPPGRELYPVTGLSWAGAAVVCNWLSEMDGEDPCFTFTPGNTLHLYEVTCDFTETGYRLPTEAEWEKAARGGVGLPTGLNPNPDRDFPWGDEPVRLELAFGLAGSVRANMDATFGPLPRLRGPIFGGPLPVGNFPRGRGPYGHDDLLGNVAEWCYDWFGDDYYAVAPGSDPFGTDEVYPGVEDWKVVRGDSWFGAYIPAWSSFTFEEGCSKRRWATYHYRSNHIGFRVARSWI